MINIRISNDIIEGETIYSWVSRLSRTSAMFSDKLVLKTIFGTSRVRIHPYLPARITDLAKSTGKDPNDLLINHTLFPLWRYYGFDKFAGLQLAMLANAGGKVLAYSGIPHSKVKFFDGQKYCPACANDDLTNRGYSYFRVCHQIPGVNTCWIHGCLLVGIAGGDTGYDRSLVLPTGNVEVQYSTDLERQLAEHCCSVLDDARGSVCAYDYASVYPDFLGRSGYLAGKNIAYSKIRHELQQFYSVMSRQGDMGVPMDILSFDYVGPLLRKKTHFVAIPIKHLLFSFWLLGSDTSVSPRIAPNENGPHVPTINNAKGRELREKDVLESLRANNSLIETARITGKSKSFVTRVALLNGIVIKSNSRATNSSVIRKIVRLGMMGLEPSNIAVQCGVGIGVVEKTISGTGNLVRWRKHLRDARSIHSAVIEIQKAVMDHPDWIRKDIKSHHQASFFRLYYHDRELLNTILPPKTKPLPKKTRRDVDF